MLAKVKKKRQITSTQPWTTFPTPQQQAQMRQKVRQGAAFKTLNMTQEMRVLIVFSHSDSVAHLQMKTSLNIINNGNPRMNLNKKLGTHLKVSPLPTSSKRFLRER